MGQLDLHLGEEALEQYAMSGIEAQSEAVEEHLLVCDSCRDALDAVDEEIRLIRKWLHWAQPLQKGR